MSFSFQSAPGKYLNFVNVFVPMFHFSILVQKFNLSSMFKSDVKDKKRKNNTRKLFSKIQCPITFYCSGSLLIMRKNT